MSRAARRRERLAQIYRSAPPEQAGAMVLTGLIYALATVTLNIALAVVLARSVREGWRVRHRGPAAAVQAGVNPALIGLVGAMTINELVRAVVFRTLIRPALPWSEASSSPPSDRMPGAGGPPG